ncbi:hypothetical protein ACFLUH_04180, partial [Chloroflexota bacterium]
GLAVVLTLTLALAAIPAADAEAGPPLKWNRTDTPTVMPDLQLQPGTDLYDMAIGPDGDTVYVVGSVTNPFGYIDIDDGEIWSGPYSGTDEKGRVWGWYEGDVSNLEEGPFSAWHEMESTFGVDPDPWRIEVCGEVRYETDHNGDPSSDDSIVFYGYIESETGGIINNTCLVIDNGIVSVDDGEGGMDKSVTLGWLLGGRGFYDEKWDYLGMPGTPYAPTILDGGWTTPKMWKSTDGGETWMDVTDEVQDAIGLPAPFARFSHVAVPDDDGDFVTVAGCLADGWPETFGYSAWPAVVASKDGGSNFTYTGDMLDNSQANDRVFSRWGDLAVAPETNGVHSVAAAGMAIDLGADDAIGGGAGDADTLYGAVWRLDAGTWLAAGWSDTSSYPGWGGGPNPDMTDGFVTSVVFSTSFDLDRAIITLGNDGDTYFQQSGVWEPGNGTWNNEAGYTPAVEIRDTGNAIAIANTSPDCSFGTSFGDTGIALPSDYDGTLPPKAVTLIYVNGYNPTVEAVGGWVFRVDFGTVSPRTNPSNNPYLHSIAYHGTVDSGKAMAGTLATPGQFCSDVQVFRAADLDICCPKWYAACKPPTGTTKALVAYTADGTKAYGITVCQESAFSVSMDDGRSWNQWGLIDTWIDSLGDVQVTGDCEKAYVTSTNEWYCGLGCDDEWIYYRIQHVYNLWSQFPGPSYAWWQFSDFLEYHVDPDLADYVNSNCTPWLSGSFSSSCAGYYCEEWLMEQWEPEPPCSCDSVWRSEIDEDGEVIGDFWERVLCQEFSDSPGDPGLLRIPVDEIHPSAVYLGDYDSKNMWYSLDQGQCWTKTPALPIDIQDFAVENESTVYVLADNGDVTMSDAYGRHWTKPLSTKVGSGHTITAIPDGKVLVGGYDGGKVAHSDDGAATFSLTPPIPGVNGDVHVAWAPLCPDTIFVATLGDMPGGGGIFRHVIGEAIWKNLGANPTEKDLGGTSNDPHGVDFTGIVLGKSDGTLYASYVSIDGYTGVARNLDPCETACCDDENWSWLITGLGCGEVGCEEPCEMFFAEPSALRICGCWTADSDSTLWTIDSCNYDMEDGLDGTLWQYVDCVA